MQKHFNRGAGPQAFIIYSIYYTLSAETASLE